MKKVTYLSILMIAMIVIMGSCEKTVIDPEPTEVEMFIENFTGAWDFVSLEFEGRTYIDCNYELKQEYDLSTFIFNDVSTTNLTMYSDCYDEGDVDNWTWVYGYSIIDEHIQIGERFLKFKILNFDTFDGVTLELELIESLSPTNHPMNGIFTFSKR